MRAHIALHGSSGSGKSTFAALLVAEFGYLHCKTGTACRELCRDLFDSEDKTLLNKVTDALREIDSTVWLRAALRHLGDAPERPIVLDSIRFHPDYEFARQRGFVTVHINAPLEDRTERLRLRAQAFDPRVDDAHAAEQELAEMRFDFRLDNTRSRDEFEASVRELMLRLNA